MIIACTGALETLKIVGLAGSRKRLPCLQYIHPLGILKAPDAPQFQIFSVLRNLTLLSHRKWVRRHSCAVILQNTAESSEQTHLRQRLNCTVLRECINSERDLQTTTLRRNEASSGWQGMNNSTQVYYTCIYSFFEPM